MPWGQECRMSPIYGHSTYKSTIFMVQHEKFGSPGLNTRVILKVVIISQDRVLMKV